MGPQATPQIAPTIGLVSSSAPAQQQQQQQQPGYLPPRTTTILPIEVTDNPHGFEYFGEDMIDIQRKVYVKRQEQEIKKLEKMYANYPEYLAQLEETKKQLREYLYVFTVLSSQFRHGDKKGNSENKEGRKRITMDKVSIKVCFNWLGTVRSKFNCKRRKHKSFRRCYNTQEGHESMSHSFRHAYLVKIATLISDEVARTGQWEEVTDESQYYSSYYRPSSNPDPYALRMFPSWIRLTPKAELPPEPEPEPEQFYATGGTGATGVIGTKTTTEKRKRDDRSDDDAENDEGVLSKEAVEALGEKKEKTIDRFKIEKLNRLAGANPSQPVAFKKRKTNQGMRRAAPTGTKID